MGEQLSLVVARAPSVDMAVPDLTAEWRMFPVLQRLSRLHIVMTVNEQGRFSWHVEPLPIDDRMPSGAQDQNPPQSRLAQVTGKPLSTLGNAGRARWI